MFKKKAFVEGKGYIADFALSEPDKIKYSMHDGFAQEFDSDQQIIDLIEKHNIPAESVKVVQKLVNIKPANDAEYESDLDLITRDDVIDFVESRNDNIGKIVNSVLKTNRQLHEEAAGMNLENSFFAFNKIDPDAIPEDELEREAMRRFFAGEEPNWTTGICEFLQAGYGECSSNGYYEFTLPYPAEQWSKEKKPHDLKIRLNGMKYKARIVPFNSNEIIKRNFLHLHYWNGVKLPDDAKLEESFNWYCETLKETKDGNSFKVTNAVGENVQEHKGRMYLEIVDETYQPTGLTNEEWLNKPIDK